MKKTKKALAALAIMGMAATMVTFDAFAATGVTTDRLYGTDRIGTAVKVADKFVSATTAILAPSADANLVDALAAAPLAGKTSPILLTDNNTLSAATKAELIKLKVTKVYVVGAISQAVVDQANAMPGVTATPLKGADRIATAALISAKLTNPAGSFVVGYDALADALSVASFAAANNYSILVANTAGSLPASEGAYKGAHKGAYKGAKVYTVGGDTLVADIAGATRLAGADRFATNKVVLDTLGYSYNKTYVANGTDAHLVDSLVASSLAALAGAPIVLTDTATGGDATAADIGAKLDDNAVVVALGGDTVVTATTLAKVTSPSTTPTAPVIPSVTVLTADEQLMVDTINQERIDAGLNPVIADLRLTAVGRAKANDMKVNNYFSHTSPTYGSPWAMMQQVGLTVKWAGENISGNKSVSGSMAALMLSPGHRANILDPRFTHVGVGIAYGSAYGNLYVQEFLQE